MFFSSSSLSPSSFLLPPSPFFIPLPVAPLLFSPFFQNISPSLALISPSLPVLPTSEKCMKPAIIAKCISIVSIFTHCSGEPCSIIIILSFFCFSALEGHRKPTCTCTYIYMDTHAQTQTHINTCRGLHAI